MNKTRFAFGCMLGALALSAAPVAQATIIFSDTFATSTLNSAAPAAPTSTSTNYQVLSTKDATGSSIAAGSLQLNMVNTSSGFAEFQNLFTSTPVLLAQTGDYIEAKVCFKPTGLNRVGNGTLNFALLDSNGAGPVLGTQLNNEQLDDSGVFTTGNAAGWEGYVGRIGRVGGASSQIFTRPAQVGETTAEAQDALFNNAGGGAFDNPTGTTVQGGGTGATLTDGTEYTLLYRITFDAGTGFATVRYELSDTNGVVSTLTGVTTAPTTIATAFDAFSIGYRGTDSIGPYSLNISCLEIDTNTVAEVPEPASLVMLSLLGVGAFCYRRK